MHRADAHLAQLRCLLSCTRRSNAHIAPGTACWWGRERTVSSSYFHSAAPDTCGAGESRHSMRPVSLCTRRAPSSAGAGGGVGLGEGLGAGDAGGDITAGAGLGAGEGGGKGEGDGEGEGEAEGEGAGCGGGSDAAAAHGTACGQCAMRSACCLGRCPRTERTWAALGVPLVARDACVAGLAAVVRARKVVATALLPARRAGR